MSYGIGETGALGAEAEVECQVLFQGKCHIELLSMISSRQKSRPLRSGTEIQRTHAAPKAPVILLVCSLLILPIQAWAWQGKVVGVIDGDSITVMHDGQAEEVRLYGVDCPEKRQDFGQRAKEFTSTELFGKMVEVSPVTTDRYGRTVPMVALNGRNFNRRIIEVGYALVFQKYCTRPEYTEWNKVESQARASRTGLWLGQNPIPP